MATNKKKNASMYMEHGSALHRGRYKTLKEHRAAVEKQNANKAKPKSTPVSGEGRQALHMADKEDKARARRTAPVSGEGRQALRMADKENNTKQKKARQSLNDALKSVKRRNSK